MSETNNGSVNTEAKPKKRSRKRVWATVGVIAVVVIALGAGLLVWHEQPSFCAAICHNMDPYYDTYQQENNAAGVDKYGNEVSDTSTMLAVVHRTNETTGMSDITCLQCHEPTIAEQANEGINWVTGNYYAPLTEVTAGEMRAWHEAESSTFCANENCHSYLLGSDGLVDQSKLEQTTMDMEFNPHEAYHSNDMQCTTCHKSHRASVMQCTACHEHSDVAIPDGWLTAQESDALIEASI